MHHAGLYQADTNVHYLLQNQAANFLRQSITAASSTQFRTVIRFLCHSD
jgi:hypothetical protein